MAYNNSGSNTEVTSCSKECEESYAKLKKLYDEQNEQLGDASIEIQAYTQALKSQISAKDKSGLGYGDQIHEGVLSYENEVLESVFDSRSSDVEDSPVNDRFAKSKTNESANNTSDSVSDESNSSVETLESVPKPVVNEPKAVSKPKVWSHAPIIEEYDFSHLIRDYDFHEKRMAKQVELNKQKGKGTGQGENRPVWNNVQRLNHQNKFVPKAVLTKTGIFPVNAARQNLSSQAATTSTARKVNTARPIDNPQRALKNKGIPVRSENQANKTAGLEEANHSAGTQDNIEVGAARADHVGRPDLTNYADQDDSQIPALEDIYDNPNDGFFTNASYGDEDILKKFDFANVKTASTPIETHKPLVKDEEAADVDVHLYRFQVTPKTSHLHAVKRIFRYLKGKPKLGLWYPKESSFDLVAYSDSDYGGANLDRKSTIGGCQFLGLRLILWQCKKQTIVTTSTTEAEYVAAANYCGQNLVFHSKTKHIEIRHHFIRDAYEKKLIPENPTIYASFIKQFWTTATASTNVNGEVELTASIDGQVKTITEVSLRRHLKLEDNGGITSLPNTEIFEQLALMGYTTDSDKLTFQKELLICALSVLDDGRLGRNTGYLKELFELAMSAKGSCDFASRSAQ
ncbi:putative ribonuclease H-like domain-containing protein [Tanacetum coccineum]